MSDLIDRQTAIDAIISFFKLTDYNESAYAVRTVLGDLPSVTPKQRTDLLKAEIKRMKRSFTVCINSDYYTGYMSALSAVEGYIAQLEGKE